MSDFINQLISEGEHQQLDFKFEISDAKKIARSLSAFANTDGGRLLIGVKDNGKIIGIRSDEEMYMIETAAHIHTKPEVKYTTQTHVVDGRTVLEVKVEQSKNRPHYAPDKNDKWRAYIRIKDENQIANGVIIKTWQRLTSSKGVYLKYAEPEKRILQFVEQNNTISFRKAQRICKINSHKTENILANFIAIGIFEPIFEDKTIKYTIKR